MDYLAAQFPEDYPKEKKPEPPKHIPTAEEEAERKKKEMIDYSKEVATEAKDYQNSLEQAEKDKKEAYALSRMGMEGEPVALQLDSQINKFDEDAQEA